jgi:hypothetical protein
MHIPPEILHKIVREATIVPEAFDTLFDSVLQEDREAVLKAIQMSIGLFMVAIFGPFSAHFSFHF